VRNTVKLNEGCVQNLVCSCGNMPVCDAAFLVSFQSVEVLDLYVFLLTFFIILRYVLEHSFVTCSVRDFTFCAFILGLLG
jgi:hypothetical protein